MTWKKAFKWATPVWIVTIGAISGLMFLTDFATDVGIAEAFKRLCLVALVALPLVAFLIRATVGDVARFRAVFLKENGDESQR